MFWFDKSHPDTLYIDNRIMSPVKMSNGATVQVKPDILMDFRKMSFDSETFNLVVFDPPHIMKAGHNSYLAKKYGLLDRNTWKDDLKKGFIECFRVLKPGGVLIFKWNETDIPTSSVLALSPNLPLFGNRSGKASKTHWIVFMKATV